MPKTAVISARIDPDLKRGAEEVFDQLGLSATQAITLFYKQVELERGLPFAVRVPNPVTEKALGQARTREALVSYNTLEDLFDDLGIDEGDQADVAVQARCQAAAAARQGCSQAEKGAGDLVEGRVCRPAIAITSWLGSTGARANATLSPTGRSSMNWPKPRSS